MVLARRDEPEVVAASPGEVDGRRWMTLAAVIAVVLVAAVLVALPRVLRSDDRAGTTSVRGGPSSAPAPPTVELQPQAGWSTLLADGDRLVVGTRPLAQRDLLLAVLARDDVAFASFPADGAVMVIGGDALTAKYVGDPARATRTTTPNGGEAVSLGPDDFIGPGPALALGPPRTMPGGVVARRGDLPRSTRTLAAYFGPRADPALVQQAEAMAATARVLPVDPVLVPPPPPGSRPGFDSGQAAGDQARPVVSFTIPGSTYTARADGDCAGVWLNTSTQPMAGGCSPGRPAGTGVTVVAATANPGMPPAPPGQSFAPDKPQVVPAVVVLARVGPDARRVAAVLVDGRTVSVAVGNDGWAVVATGGRPFLLEVRDKDGKPVSQTPVK